MAALTWDTTGERYYETGVDHGVLYPGTSVGVAWNGLTSITESPSGGESSAQYGDNTKYLNLVSVEELGGTIEALAYPPEFTACDGGRAIVPGLFVGQQTRQTFGLSYRTRIGNDTDGPEHGYKIHIIYNALASPAEKAYGTVNDSPEAVSFSWEFSSNPVNVGGNYKPTAHLSIDSTKVKPETLSDITDILYGTSSTPARLLYPADIIALFAAGLEMRYDTAQDLFTLFENGLSDLAVTTDEGVYAITSRSRLTGSSTSGFYSLGS